MLDHHRLGSCPQVAFHTSLDEEDRDVLVLDAVRHKPHPTHFTLDEAVSVARRVGARRTLFTHMTHDLPHRATCETLPEDMTLAYDGLTLDVAGASLEHLLLSAVKAISS